jgi:hypothetical protein
VFGATEEILLRPTEACSWILGKSGEEVVNVKWATSFFLVREYHLARILFCLEDDGNGGITTANIHGSQIR